MLRFISVLLPRIASYHSGSLYLLQHNSLCDRGRWHLLLFLAPHLMLRFYKKYSTPRISQLSSSFPSDSYLPLSICDSSCGFFCVLFFYILLSLLVKQITLSVPLSYISLVTEKDAHTMLRHRNFETAKSLAIPTSLFRILVKV